LARLRRFHSDRIDLFLGRRSGPGSKLVDAVERDDNKPLGRRPLQRGGIFGAYDDLAAEGGIRRSGLRTERFESVRFSDLADIDDDISRQLGLRVQSLNQRPADGGACAQRKSQLGFRFQGLLRLLSTECNKT